MRGLSIDGGPPLTSLPQRPLANPTPLALERPLIEAPLPTGVRHRCDGHRGGGPTHGDFAGQALERAPFWGKLFDMLKLKSV